MAREIPMRLQHLTFSELEGQPSEWRLEPMPLKKINLIVGKNASGKTRVMNVINGLANGLAAFQPNMPRTGTFDVEFDNDGKKLSYHLRYENSQVAEEKVTNDSSEILMERKPDGTGVIHSVEHGLQKFSTPSNFLAVVARQDPLQHPELAQIAEWGRKTFFYPFASDLGKSMLFAEGLTELNLRDANQTAHVLQRGLETLGAPFKDAIISDMKAIGYHLEDLGFTLPSNLLNLPPAFSNAQVIVAREVGLTASVEQLMMSNGMFRALALIIQINYGLMNDTPSTVLVDDIGEGLDFDRSAALIRLLVDKVERSEMQLIMTTNDRYVMNGVPLDYWIVLSRNGSIVRAFTKENKPDVFEEFEFTGLSNFDFLARDFLNSEQL